jgi:hypothetical protein
LSYRNVAIDNGRTVAVKAKSIEIELVAQLAIIATTATITPSRAETTKSRSGAGFRGSG